MEITAAGIHGGPSADFDDDDDDGEPRYYGVHLTVKLISPTEQKIRSITETDGAYAVGEPERHSSVRDEPTDEHIESLESNSPIEQKLRVALKLIAYMRWASQNDTAVFMASELISILKAPKATDRRKNQKRLSFLGTVAILLLAFMVLTGISNALAKALHTTKHPTGERLNINNIEKYAPDFSIKQDEQADTSVPRPSSDGVNQYPEDVAEIDPPEATAEESSTYILNTNTKVFHRQNCSSAKRIKDSRRSSATGTRDEIIEKGYSPCGICKP